MRKKAEIQGRAAAFKLYKLDKETRDRIQKGGSFHPLSYVRPMGVLERAADTELFGLLPEAQILSGKKRKPLVQSKAKHTTHMAIELFTLIVAQGFEGTIYEGEAEDPFIDLPRSFDTFRIEYPDGLGITLAVLKPGAKGIQRYFWQRDATPLKARLIDAGGVTKDLDEWINAQRHVFEKAISDSDHTTIKQLIADGFNPAAEYSGENFKEIPQLFCKDVKTYKLLESLNAVVAVSSESTETIQSVEAYAFGHLGLEVLRYIADQDGSLNSDWDGSNGRLAIHCAVLTGDLQAVKAILDAGADLHIASNDGETALGLALDQENSGIVTFLLSQGASLNLSDYRQLDLDGDEVEIDDPRDSIRSAEMSQITSQFR